MMLPSGLHAGKRRRRPRHHVTSTRPATGTTRPLSKTAGARAAHHADPRRQQLQQGQQHPGNTLNSAYQDTAPDALWADVFEEAYRLDASHVRRLRTMRRAGTAPSEGGARADQRHRLASLTAQELRIIAQIKETQAALLELAHQKGST